MDHFLRLARHGKPNTGCSSGELCAHKFALAILAYTPGLDDEALEGAIEFLRIVQTKPSTARDLVEGNWRDADYACFVDPQKQSDPGNS